MLKSKLSSRACRGPWQPSPWGCGGHTAHGSLAGSPAVAVFPGHLQMLCRCPLWSPRSTALWSPGPSSPLSCRKARKGHQVLRVMASSCRCWTPPWTTEKQTNPAIRYGHELLACSLLSGHWRGFIIFFFQWKRSFLFEHQCWMLKILYNFSKISRLKGMAAL